MNKIWTIAFREFTEIVQTRIFLISSVLIPIGIVGLVLGIEPLMKWMSEEESEQRTVAIIDHTGKLYEHLVAQTSAADEQEANPKVTYEDHSDATTDDMQAAVQRGEYYAYLELPTGIVDGSESARLGRKDNQLTVMRLIKYQLEQALRIERGLQSKPAIAYETLMKIMAPISIESVDVATGEAKKGSEAAAFMIPFAFIFLIFMGTMGISQHLLTSLIEEKNSRIIEVLLSAVSPLQLMAGKIIGIAGVGILLLLIWGSLGYFSARWQEMSYLVQPMDLFYTAIYFVPTFLLLSAALGAIGSISNTLKEAQSMQSPLSIIMILPMMLWMVFAENPNSTTSVIASFVPILSPFVMILRLTATPDIPVWQIIVTQIMLWASAIFVVWAAAKVFRMGVLMYGKQPSVGELITWLRRA